MEVTLSTAHRAQWREFDAKHGHDATFAAIQMAVAGSARLDLFSMSLDWLRGDYALKCKGARGDLLVVFS